MNLVREKCALTPPRTTVDVVGDLMGCRHSSLIVRCRLRPRVAGCGLFVGCRKVGVYNAYDRHR